MNTSSPHPVWSPTTGHVTRIARMAFKACRPAIRTKDSSGRIDDGCRLFGTLSAFDGEETIAMGKLRQFFDDLTMTPYRSATEQLLHDLAAERDAALDRCAEFDMLLREAAEDLEYSAENRGRQSERDYDMSGELARRIRTAVEK